MPKLNRSIERLRADEVRLGDYMRGRKLGFCAVRALNENSVGKMKFVLSDRSEKLLLPNQIIEVIKS